MRPAGVGLCFFAAAFVAGCGGSSGGPSDGPGPDAPPAPYYDTTTWGTAFADMILEEWPDANDIYPGVGFQYNNGIVLRGIQRMYERTRDARYLAYIADFVDGHIGPAGEDLAIPVAYDVDNFQPSVLLNFLYDETGQARYLAAADYVRGRYDGFPTNVAGGFWHKMQYPNELWCDTIYMTTPFLTGYAAITDCGAYCADTATHNVVLLAEHAQEPGTGLMRHAWDADEDANEMAAWADPVTGLAPMVWSRGTGWYAMSLVDILDDLPLAHPQRGELIRILGALVEGLRDTQDAETGLWHQVVDMGALPDNWIETSGSAMFVYAIKKAVDRGYLDASFLDVAIRGWEGLKDVVETASTGGTPTITGAVQGMGVQTTYGNYVNKTRLTNSSHGLCAILMAASQMERYDF